MPGTDGATFVTDAGLGRNKGFLVHCRHAHCDGKDRLFFVKRMLEQEWLTIADLTDPEFLVKPADEPVTGRKAAVTWPPPIDFSPTRTQLHRNCGRGMSRTRFGAS